MKGCGMWTAQGFSETWQLDDVWGRVSKECIEGWIPIKAGVGCPHSRPFESTSGGVRQASLGCAV